MIGTKISESKGKRILRRILSANPPTAEVTFDDSGTLAGVAANGTGTYTSVIRPDGTIFGKGQGLMLTSEGDSAVWEGSGIGKFGPGGSVSYRGMIFFTSNSPKLAAIHNACGAFEFEVDAAGNTSSNIWEWK